MAVLTVSLCSAQLAVNQAEYFWDTDPGEGLGTAITAADGNFNGSLEKIALSGLGAPSVGLHKFSVRLKDNTGAWSPVFTNVIRVEPTTTPIPVSLTQAEYFWDTDPGEGNATVITAVDGNLNSTFEKIALSGLGAPSVGLHKFSCRIKDNAGEWSPVFTNVVMVEPNTTPTPISLIQAEYFWDTDPGEGNATALLATDSNFDSTFEKVAVAGLGAPSIGLHKFSFRVKDNQGVWGPVATNVIVVEATTTPTPINLTQAEYFWDTDPGEGNGMAFDAVDGNFDTTFEKISKTGIAIVNPVGLHSFNVRVKDNTGAWGDVFKNTIYIETVLASEHFDLSGLKVYPNPVKNILNVSFDKEISTVAIYNLLGQGVIERAINTTDGQVDVSGLSTGTYIVKVTSENKVKTLKVIKE